MEWLSLHADAVVVLGAVVSGVLWMNHQINALNNKISGKLNDLDRRLIRIETALMIHGMLPGTIAENQD